jgi:hypothetical protein
MRLTAIILILALAACGNDQPSGGYASENSSLCKVLPGKADSISPTKSGIQYFPPSFGKIMHVCNFKGYPECFPKVSAFENERYSKHWEAAQEPSLYQISEGNESAHGSVLRFTWLPTFHHPVVVRFEISPGSTTLIAKELSGAGGYEPGTINRQINRKLNSAEARQLTEAMAKASPFNEPPAKCELGLDGSQWMLERTDKDGYDYASGWSPENGPMRDFGMLALKLTGWKFEEIY